jgi:hypothetical protein
MPVAIASGPVHEDELREFRHLHRERALRGNQAGFGVDRGLRLDRASHTDARCTVKPAAASGFGHL